MDLRYYFVLGSKLIGFYCLVLTIMHFVPLVLSIFDTSEYSSEQFEYGKIVFVFSMLTPILLAVIGVYLIKDGSLVHELAFRNGGAPTSRSSELFTMSIKVYGLYLAAVNIPDFFKLLANRILVGHLPYDLGKYVLESIDLKINLLPFLIVTLVGIYFLLWGETLTRVVFRPKRNWESEA